MALPRRHIPDHNQRGDDINSNDYLNFVKRVEHLDDVTDNLPHYDGGNLNELDDYLAAVRAVYDAAAAILDVGAVDPAANRRTPDNDGDLWQLLAEYGIFRTRDGRDLLRAAIAARYGSG